VTAWQMRPPTRPVKLVGKTGTSLSSWFCVRFSLRVGAGIAPALLRARQTREDGFSCPARSLLVCPRMDGETRGALPTQPPDEAAGERGEGLAGSGWTTTKQAAKVLGVSRRSVQGYVRRGLLEAREEGEGVNKRFIVSIDSLNALRERRSGEAIAAEEFAGASAESEEAANLVANADEGLRHVVDRLEARTAEATELRVRLEITEKAESTVRSELAEERRRREAAERERENLRRELQALQEARESPVSPGPTEETPTPAPGGAQAATQRPQGGNLRGWRRRIFGW